MIKIPKLEVWVYFDYFRGFWGIFFFLVVILRFLGHFGHFEVLGFFAHSKKFEGILVILVILGVF